MRTSKISKLIGGGAAAAVLVGATLAGATSAQAGVTSCGAQGGKQEGGAVIGALLGGLLGNSVSGHNRTTGTVVGAVAGAAAGSAVGCEVQKKDARNDYGYQPATYTQGGYRLSSHIAPASYQKVGETFVANTGVNLRSAPTTNSGRLGALRAGERFEALAEVRGTDWILVGQGGVGVGYVNARYVQPLGYRYAAY